MKIYLACHGEDEDNANGIYNGWRNKPLTVRGKHQAHTLGYRLREHKIRRILTSPLRRARETALITADILGCAVHVLPSLIERKHGVIEGCKYEDVGKFGCVCERVGEHVYVISGPGVESHALLYERALIALMDIQITATRLRLAGKLAVQENMVALSHSAIIRQMIAAHEGREWERISQGMRHLGNAEFQVIEI